MRVTTELLKTIGNITVESTEIEKLLKEHITNVEYSHNIGDDYKGIVVAEIVEKEEHPDADKLGVYQVFTGRERVQVVAGDKTLEIGDKVAYIPPGSIVPTTIYTEEKPIIIESVKLRGVQSNGMLGSEKELNLGPDHEYVMRLSEDASPGTSFADYFIFNDIAIEIENKGLTNRGDLFGLVGIARELTAITGNKFENPSWYTDKRKNLKPEENCLNIQVVNDAEALCPRYVAVAMDHIVVGPSPIWLQSALLRLDIKPINNIIDITNYISALFGQPLHAFDYDKTIKIDPAPDNKVTINVRMARQGEKILGLDHKTHELNDRTIVIADNNHPIAIAGVIGGQDTSVDENSKRIIFESANFDKNSIRRTSMELGISTDASTKFKHSLDTEACVPAILRAVELAKEIAEGKVASEIIDIYEEPYEEKIVTVDIKKLNTHIGLDLSKEVMSTILTNLGYKITSSDNSFITVVVPSWRRDVQIPEDIHEDIARIYGYNNIDVKLPRRPITSLKDNKIFDLKKDIRKQVSALGLNEILTYSFTSLDYFKKSSLDADLAYKVKNALSPELSLMRVSLLQSIFQKVKENKEKGFNKFGLFEINIPHINTYIGEDSLPKEDWHFSAVMIDSTISKSQSSYYLAKKYTEKILSTRNVKADFVLVADSLEQDLDEDIKAILNIFDSNVSALCVVDKKVIGVLGEIKNSVKESYKLPEYSCCIDVNLSKLLEIKMIKKEFRDIPIYPTYSVDFCFETDMNVTYGDMEKELDKIMNSNDSWGRVEGLDIYQDKKDKERKRTTFRVIGSNYKKTVINKDIKAISEKIKMKFKEKFGAKTI